MDIGITEYIGLIIFEGVLASLTSAYQPMQKKRKLVYLLLAFIPFSFMTMFHGLDIGNDTGIYSKFFYTLQWSSFEASFENQRFEKGYIFLVWLLANVFSDSQWLFVITGGFICFSVIYFLYKCISAPGLFVVLCVEMLTLDSWMSMNRQVVALGIILLAFCFLVQKQDKKFLICNFIATLFHNASFVFFILYICWHIIKRHSNNHINEKKIMIEMLVVGILITVTFSALLNIMISIFPVYSYYLEGDYIDGSARIAIILNLIIGIIMISLPSILEYHNISNNKNNNIGMGLYICSLLSVLLTFVSLQATVIMRLTSIFSMFLMGYYTENVASLKINKNRTIMTVISIIAFGIYGLIITIYRTPQWQTTYPFHFFY